MIRDIEVENWRAYQHLQLTLSRPVTFFVAPNGVGKSSLVEAVRWGLFGALDPKSRGRAVRSGYDTATVRLRIELPSCGQVEVTRRLRRSGTATFTATVAGDAIDEHRYHQLLREAWAADPHLLDALMFEPIATAGVAFPVREHLAAVFGIQPLLSAAKVIKKRRADLTSRIKTLREDQDATQAAILDATANAEDQQARLAAVAAARATADRTAADLEPAAALAAAWDRYRNDVHRYNERIRDLAAQIANALQMSEREPQIAIAAGREQAAAALETALAAKAAAEVRTAAAANAADLLSHAVVRCPTCLRPLTDGERDQALVAHGDTDEHARHEISRLHEQTESARHRLAAIAQFANALAALPAPAAPAASDPGQLAATALAVARTRQSELAEQHGAHSAELAAARRRVVQLQRAADEQTALIAAAREDIVAEVVERTLIAVADRYTADRIEPLTHEIGRRWKLVFGAEGLHMSADGRLTVNHADIDLTLADLSGGERATALLVTRLLLAGSAARASTIWFDEPLEHLDPQRRAAVARTLVMAARTGTVPQILVTTYEEGLARRLAASDPDLVALTYAGTTQL
jgi:DNA repair exonuclease SbcCD ATPase subunit